MLIARKSHARVEKRNSRVSIKTLDFARGRTFYRRDRSWIASRGAKGGVIAGWSLTPLPGPHLRLQTIDTADGGAPETLQNGRGEGTGERE